MALQKGYFCFDHVNRLIGNYKRALAKFWPKTLLHCIFQMSYNYIIISFEKMPTLLNNIQKYKNIYTGNNMSKQTFIEGRILMFYAIR